MNATIFEDTYTLALKNYSEDVWRNIATCTLQGNEEYAAEVTRLLKSGKKESDVIAELEKLDEAYPQF